MGLILHVVPLNVQRDVYDNGSMFDMCASHRCGHIFSNCLCVADGLKPRPGSNNQRMLIKILKVLFLFYRSVTSDYQNWSLVFCSLNQRCDGVSQTGTVCNCCNPETTSGLGSALRHQHRVGFVGR